MMAVKSIALNTFRELIRERYFFVVLFLALLMFVLSFFLGALSFDEQRRILVHFGLSAIHLAVLGLSIFLGASVISKEIERQTCLLVLVRPLSRHQFVVGKWLGILLLLLFVSAGLGFFLYLLLGFSLPSFDFCATIFGLFLEGAVLLTAAVVAGLVLRPAVAVFATVGIFLIGNWQEELLYFADKSRSEIYLAFAKGVHWFFPQLYRFNWRSLYQIENDLIRPFLFGVTIHGIGWSLFLLMVATFVFRRKDLV